VLSGSIDAFQASATKINQKHLDRWQIQQRLSLLHKETDLKYILFFVNISEQK